MSGISPSRDRCARKSCARSGPQKNSASDLEHRAQTSRDRAHRCKAAASRSGKVELARRGRSQDRSEFFRPQQSRSTAYSRRDPPGHKACPAKSSQKDSNKPLPECQAAAKKGAISCSNLSSIRLEREKELSHHD